MAAPGTTSEYVIRYDTETDVPIILTLLRELADYGNQSLSAMKTTEEMLLTTLSFAMTESTSQMTKNATPLFTQGYARTLLISPQASPNTAVGLAVYFPNYST
jgi:hypothetical protein